MKALLVCATFGRIPYLPTMLAGFLMQDYPDKELVIINDDINIFLKCRHEGVTVINCNKRLLLSEKRNLGIASGYHDIIFPYDDDDIFLPKRISNHIKQYDNDDVMGYRNLSTYITYGGIFKKDSGPPNDFSFRKKAWFEVGGYVNKEITGEDVEIYNKISPKLVVSDDQNMDFVYCFSGINYHLSCGQTQETIDERAYIQLVDMNLLGKEYWIEPDFDEYRKYLTLVDTHAKTGQDLRIEHLKHGKINICLTP